MADITKPIMLNETGALIASADGRIATAVESIAQTLSGGGSSVSGGFNPWANKKVCVFGDSIAAGYGVTDNYSFVDILEDANIFNSVHKNAVNGSPSNTLNARVEESSTEVAAADIIYACYEGNDITGIKDGTLTGANLVSSLRIAVNTIRTANPTCAIVWLPLTICHLDKIGGADASHYLTWSNAMYPVFAELGINMLPIYDTLGAGHAQQDGRHPNAAGHQAIADIIMQNPLGYSNYPISISQS